MSLRSLKYLLLPAFAVLAPMAAHACTVCNSRTGHQLRAGLFNGHFGQTLALVLCPFPVFGAALASLHRWMPAIGGFTIDDNPAESDVSSLRAVPELNV